LLERTTDQGITFARWVNGQAYSLSGVFDGALIPSTDGRIFLGSTDDDAGVVSVVEVACGAAQ